jgi:fatty acid desaturase
LTSNQPARLDSEEVVIAAPMSLTGSAQRLWKLTHSAPANAWASAAIYTGVVLLITVVWAAVLCWYFIFGLWLVPYRLIRRGQRKRHMQDLRHREMLTMMHQMGQQQVPPRSRGTLPPAGN